MINYESSMKKAGHIFRVEAIHVKDINGNPDFVEFLPYLEGFTENYDSNWNEEDVFGRMDGISNFVGIKRSFTLSLRIAAHDLAQARENQFRLSKLIRFIYPSITPGSGGDSSFYFRGAPILKLKFGNIINDVQKHGGLYGYIQGGLSITPSHDHGWFTPEKFLKGDRVNEQQQNPKNNVGAQENAASIFYKYFDISFTFKVLHNHPLGNSASTDDNLFEYFPYGMGKHDFPDGSELNTAIANPHLDSGYLLQEGPEPNLDNLTDLGNGLDEYAEQLRQKNARDRIYKSDWWQDAVDEKVFKINLDRLMGRYK